MLNANDVTDVGVVLPRVRVHAGTTSGARLGSKGSAHVQDEAMCPVLPNQTREGPEKLTIVGGQIWSGRRFLNLPKGKARGWWHDEADVSHFNSLPLASPSSKGL